MKANGGGEFYYPTPTMLNNVVTINGRLCKLGSDKVEAFVLQNLGKCFIYFLIYRVRT